MSINSTTKAKSNKHSNDESKEFVERPLHSFTLVEPDEILKGTGNSYKLVATNWLANFNGALFKVDYPLLRANTNLTRADLLLQLNRKLGVDLEALNAYLVEQTQSVYKNLDDFKESHTFVIDNIVLAFEDWAKVELIRYDNSLNYPIHSIHYKLEEFTFEAYDIRNIIKGYFPYVKYLISIKHSDSMIAATKKLNHAYTNTYKDEFNKFKVVQVYKDDVGWIDVSDLTESPTVTFEFDIDLYFSHIKYLYKVFQTYKQM